VRPDWAKFRILEKEVQIAHGGKKLILFCQIKAVLQKSFLNIANIQLFWNQGDQIGRIFANGAVVFFGQFF
jgi:hypothetical protein